MINYSKDPVCGMQVNEEQADFNKMFIEREGKKVYFCSPHCKEVFEQEPARYSEQKRAAAKGIW